MIINIAIYLDVLAPIKSLSVSLHEERHSPVKAICRIAEFAWTMGKLKCLIDESLVQDKSNMTHFTLLMSKIEVKEGKQHYQGTELSKYNKSFSAVKESYHKTIAAISDSMESRFSNLRASPLFENLVDLLKTKVWPEENFETFGDVKLQILVDHFREVLLKRNCKIDFINAELQVLKSFMVPLIKNNKALPYLDTWKRVFTNSELKSKCKNVLHLFEILFAMSFTNAKLERMFSQMLRVKFNWCNQLTRDHLDS